MPVELACFETFSERNKNFNLSFDLLDIFQLKISLTKGLCFHHRLPELLFFTTDSL